MWQKYVCFVRFDVSKAVTMTMVFSGMWCCVFGQKFTEVLEKSTVILTNVVDGGGGS